MAETLGSLVDKLAIKELRQHFLKEMLKSRVGKFSPHELKKRLKLIHSQKRDLIKEINNFIFAAAQGEMKIRDEKLKLYNAPEYIGRIHKSNSLGRTMSLLAKKNLELWNLEDEARRSDVSNAYIGKIKRKIDKANQQRNDLIDALDKLLERCLKKSAYSS